MKSGAILDFQSNVFKLFIPKRASLTSEMLTVSTEDWLPLRNANYHLGKFPAESAVSLSLLRIKFEQGKAYVLFRASSFLKEMQEIKSPSLKEIQDIAFWNDTVAVWFSQADGCWSVMANRACSLPIFWTSLDGEIICSNSINEVLANRSPSIDSIGLSEALIFDAPLRDRTIWSEVRQIPAGYALDVSAVKASLTKKMELRIGNNVSGKVSELAEYAAVLTRRATRLALNTEKDVLVTMSGGLDSRGIAASLPTGLHNASAIGYGHKHSLELIYSRAAAKILNLPWQSYYLDSSHFKRSFLAVVQRTGGMMHRMHCHMAGAVELTEPRAVVLLPGFMGDPVQGSRSGVEQRTESVISCPIYLLNKYRQTESSFIDMFPPNVRDAILLDLDWLVRDATSLHEPTQFDEYFFVVERQSKLITFIFNALETNRVSLAFPYMDGLWARFFLSLHRQLRFRRELFRTSLVYANEEISNLPSVASGGTVSFNSKSFISPMLWLKRLSRLQNVVETLSLGKISLPDPSQTENARHSLRTVLKTKLRRSVNEIQEAGFISSAIAEEISSVRYNRLDAHAGYRLISLAEMLGIENEENFLEMEMENHKFAHELMAAIQYAFEAHTLQAKDPANSTRNWDRNTPYVIHPIWCAMTLLSETRLSDNIRRIGCQVLLWHDILEDTKLDLPPDVLPEVRVLVEEMSFKNFADERREIWNRSDTAKLLKLYDKTSNLLDAPWMSTEQSLNYFRHTAKLAAFVRESFGGLNIVTIADAVCAAYNSTEEQS